VAARAAWTAPARRRQRRQGLALLLCLTALLTAGCAQAPRPLYQWDGYQRQIYDFLKADGSSSGDEQLGQMLALAEKARGHDAALPPGFRAHLGLLQLQAGRGDEAREAFVAEKTAFPEASPYMDFLLKRMNAPRP
jgi:hypothetical protein